MIAHILRRRSVMQPGGRGGGGGAGAGAEMWGAALLPHISAVVGEKICIAQSE